MNLSSLNFFRSLRSDNKQFAVIGLGRFGKAVSSTLYGLGYEVLGVDFDEKKVTQALTDRISSHVLQLDSTEPSALAEAGIFEFETVIVAIGNYLAESITTTLNLKEVGVSYVIAKASSETHVNEPDGQRITVRPQASFSFFAKAFLIKTVEKSRRRSCSFFPNEKWAALWPGFLRTSRSKVRPRTLPTWKISEMILD